MGGEKPSCSDKVTYVSPQLPLPIRRVKNSLHPFIKSYHLWSKFFSSLRVGTGCVWPMLGACGFPCVHWVFIVSGLWSLPCNIQPSASLSVGSHCYAVYSRPSGQASMSIIYHRSVYCSSGWSSGQATICPPFVRGHSKVRLVAVLSPPHETVTHMPHLLRGILLWVLWGVWCSK